MRVDVTTGGVDWHPVRTNPAIRPVTKIVSVWHHASSRITPERRIGVGCLRCIRLREVPTDGPYIALTFDDGPNPINTPALLDILKKRHIAATFFVLGQNASVFPRILERMEAEGHEIANHAWSHQPLTNLTPEERASQVRKTNEAIERATGHPPSLIRPPYGATTPTMNRWLSDDLKMTVVLWSVDSQDWKHHDAASTRREILRSTRPGSIILAHDIHHSTVSAMPEILDALLAKGYKFVTVSDLISRSSR